MPNLSAIVPNRIFQSLYLLGNLVIQGYTLPIIITSTHIFHQLKRTISRSCFLQRTFNVNFPHTHTLYQPKNGKRRENHLIQPFSHVFIISNPLPTHSTATPSPYFTHYSWKHKTWITTKNCLNTITEKFLNLNHTILRWENEISFHFSPPYLGRIISSLNNSQMKMFPVLSRFTVPFRRLNVFNPPKFSHFQTLLGMEILGLRLSTEWWAGKLWVSANFPILAHLPPPGFQTTFKEQGTEILRIPSVSFLLSSSLVVLHFEKTKATQEW